jgi:hypothetical protein
MYELMCAVNLLGIGCWMVCFWWMHCISSRQDRLLQELRDQSRRIERLSKAEHALIKEVHPQITEIKDGVQAIVSATNMKSEPEPRTSQKP